MRIHFCVPILALAVAAAATASPAAAQTGNASDVTGPLTTGSTIANLGVPTATTPAISPAILLVAVDAAAVTVAAELSDVSLTTPVGTPIPVAAQSMVLAVGIGVDPPALLAQALGSGAPVSVLADAMAGLLFAPTPERVTAATRAFNDVVMAASPEYLADPPAAFDAVRAVLQTMLAAAPAVE